MKTSARIDKEYRRPPAQLLWAAAFAMTLTLGACGGGGESQTSNTSESTNQLVKGIVTGFGSVVVDGIEIEDINAKVQVDQLDGTGKGSLLQLGQGVRVERGPDGSASKIVIDAAVVGAVSAKTSNPDRLTVAAQVVRINTTDTALPITYFGGYADFAAIATNDMVEIHGTPIYNSTTGKYEIQATRVQKQDGNSGFRVLGTVSALNTTAKTFAINGLTVQYASATLYPSGTTLADGQTLLVYANASGALSGSTLTASKIRVYTSQETQPQAKSSAVLSGVVSAYNATAKTFQLQGLVVNIGSVVPTPTNSVIRDNAYVVVSGTVNATTGAIDAKSIKVRQADVLSDEASVKLVGPISSFDDATKTMVVRNIPVDFENASNNCTTPLADGVAVAIVAKQQAGTDVVLAQTIYCKPASGTYIDTYMGTPSAINVTAQTFTLTYTGSNGQSTSKTVRWNELTAFIGITSSTLPDAPTGKLVVEGYVFDNGIVARSIRLLGSQEGDRFRGDEKGKAREDYRKKKGS